MWLVVTINMWVGYIVLAGVLKGGVRGGVCSVLLV